jgi:hypothetical protein
LTHRSSARSSSAVSRGFLAGGITPARTFFSTFHHSSRSAASASTDAAASNATFPLLTPSAWQS